jgi:hypothetical protein
MRPHVSYLHQIEHFTVIDPKLDVDTIAQETGFDPANNNAEASIKHPAVTLHKIYQIAGLSYKKHGSEIHRLVAALDFDSLYYKVRQTSLSLDKFLCEIDEALRVQPEVAPIAA